MDIIEEKKTFSRYDGMVSAPLPEDEEYETHIYDSENEK